jgi:hypothetical protein
MSLKAEIDPYLPMISGQSSAIGGHSKCVMSLGTQFTMRVSIKCIARDFNERRGAANQLNPNAPVILGMLLALSCG